MDWFDTSRWHDCPHPFNVEPLALSLSYVKHVLQTTACMFRVYPESG